MVPAMMQPPSSPLVFNCVCVGGGGGLKIYLPSRSFSVRSFKIKVWNELRPLTLRGFYLFVVLLGLGT